MKIEGRAPTRIDFAGGTLDIFPLYLFEGYGITLNASINLYAIARVEKRQDRSIKIVSHDFDRSEEFSSLDTITLDGPLGLIKNVVKNMQPATGLNLETFSLAPAKSGLGNSSSLAVAIAGAMNKLFRRNISWKKLIELAFNSELQVIRVPGGRQDYYGAIFGGIKAIWLKPEGESVERLNLSEGFLSELEKHLILVYVGRSHSSAELNWRMFRNYVEKKPIVVCAMRTIRQLALEMRDALLEEDLDEIGRLLNLEWAQRRKLAPTVETLRMRQIISACMKAGGFAAKACGAGGDGCAIILSHIRRTRQIEEEVAKRGGKVLKYRIAKRGLKVRTLEPN